MLSEIALKNDRDSGVPLLEMDKIYCDSDFNCRGQILAIDIVELARDIMERGLVEPIIVRNLWLDDKHVKDGVGEVALHQKGFRYSLVAGFRRYMAYKSHNATHIPGIVKTINSVFDAKDLNAVENLQRQDLNLYQEAKAIEHYWRAAWTREEVAKRINKSSGWVQIRYMLLKMPEEIQRAAAQGYLNTQTIRELDQYSDEPEKQLKAAGILIDRITKGEKKQNLHRVIKKKEKASTKKIRTRLDTLEMMERIRSYSKLVDRGQTIIASDIFSSQGNSLITRLLAWQAGEASNGEIEEEIETFFAKLDVIYVPTDLDYAS